MPEDLQLICRRKTIELEHDRRIKRRDVAMPDVARDSGEEDIGVTAFKRDRDRQFRNRMTLPEVFAKEKRVNAGGVTANDYVLVVVRENLRLNKVARTE